MILKKATDYDASRLFFLLEKLSYEWPLLTNVTWDEHGAAFVDITFGGFIIITAGLVVAAAAGQLRSSNAMVTIFSLKGLVLFFLVKNYFVNYIFCDFPFKCNCKKMSFLFMSINGRHIY